MGRCSIAVGISFCWLGATVVGASCCYARAQEQEVNVAAEKNTDARESSSREAGKSGGIAVKPAGESLDRDNRVGLPLLRNIAEDQKAIWIGPKHLRFADADWLVPLGGAAAAMFATDTEYSKHLSNSPSRIKYSKDLSNYGVGAMGGVTGGMWLWGHMTHDDHKIETGVLAGEAAVDSMAVFYPMKYAFGRERPLQDAYRGRFGVGGDSFPSAHAALAWSMASVIAHEYPGPLTSLFAYGLASAVSTSRITGKQHFASDVLIGSAIGWLEGMYVYRKHHDPRIGGGEWETYADAHEVRERNTGNLGSPYVPLDSWVYPAMERLAGMGLLNDEFMGMRPWARGECARLVGEADDQFSSRGSENAEVSSLIQALRLEFRAETEGANITDRGAFQLESMYSRTEYISGKPLTDGYDLAQTHINDFGRPFGEGWNTVNGFSVHAIYGRWVAYARGEERSTPTVSALPLSARAAIEQAYEKIDGFVLPLKPASQQTAALRFDWLEAYVGANASNWQFSFGRQAMWWGTGQGGSLELSNNSAPIDMFRINRVTPLRLPSVLAWLGPIRTEFFVGRLEGFEFMDTPRGLVGQWGHSLINQPFIHGQNVSFMPTRNFEFGFYRTTIFGGEGYSFTPHTFARSLLFRGNTHRGTVDKPGNRTSGLDFSYRLPYLREWVTFYGDGYTDDQFSPIAYADRSAWHAGLYFSHFPALSKLDLRIEGMYTDVPAGAGPIAPGVFYANGTWTSGYINKGDLIGSWVGRGGQGAQAWTNYWLGSRNRVQFNFRHQKVSQEFIAGGGSLTDVGVRVDYCVRPSLALGTWVQYERWLFPVIEPGAQRNVSAAFEIRFEPLKLFPRSANSSSPAETVMGGRE